MRSGERGFTYLWLIFAIALSAAALGRLAQGWSVAAERDRERELFFRGRAIAAAIGGYRDAMPGSPAWPSTWDELLEDRRGGVARRHLRRIYDDPFTGRPDWERILDEQGRWIGVHSRSALPARLAVAELPPGAEARILEHRFLAGAQRHAASAAAAAASEPGVPP